ncbi:MAG: hypothetical protein HOP16_06360 [Acidobacteria bacterium]|nr:hypothetical protein [Acidobacteriota bacterium]
MKSPLVLAGLVLVISTIARNSTAHHSTVVNFDSNREVTISGVLTEIRWLNPHSRFRVDVRNPEGRVEEWLVEMGAANTLKRAGFPTERFAVGDPVTITGAAGRRDRAVLLREVTLSNGTHLTPDMRPRAPGRDVSGE